MKKYSILILLIPFIFSCNIGNGRVGKSLDPAIEGKIDSIMAQMTIEEKIGQMSQFTVDIVGKGGNAFFSDEPFEIDPGMLDTVIGKYKVGSILNAINTRAQTTVMIENI